MSDAQLEITDSKKKNSKIPLVLGIVLALFGAGGGFYAAFNNMILGAHESTDEPDKTSDHKAIPDIEYVEIDQLVISMRAPSNAKHLVFRANLEVPSHAKESVEKDLPRIVDVLNNYLRAVEPADLEDATALVRLRGQMLRRVQVVTGMDEVNDLLIMEFVLN